MIQALQQQGQGSNIPKYLALLNEEESGKMAIVTNNTTNKTNGALVRTDRQVVFGFSDCHTAEIEFGGVDGVLATRVGRIQSQRVLQVTYNPRATSFSNLVRFVLQQQKKITTKIYYRSNEERIASKIELQQHHTYGVELIHLTVQTIQPDPLLIPKRALKNTQLRFVPMTDLQATRANRLVAKGVFNEAMHLLSPRQGMILMRSMQQPPATQSTQKFRIEHLDVPITKAWTNLSETKL